VTDRYAAARYDDLDEELTPPEPAPPEPRGTSPRSRGVALALNVLLGFFGGHRFYVGKVHSAVWQLLTLGGVGFWWLYDFILIVTGEFTDSKGRRLRHWSPEEAAAAARGGAGEVERLARELESVRTELSDLQERMDFTERMLTQQRERGRIGP
jgi:hypothetical protein